MLRKQSWNIRITSVLFAFTVELSSSVLKTENKHLRLKGLNSVDTTVKNQMAA